MIVSRFRHPLILGLSLFWTAALHAQNSAVIVQAETGQLGAEWASATVSGATAIGVQTSLSGQNPGSAARVVTYSVTFPHAGTWELYARIHVGVGAADDDSFFYGNGFGAKSPTADADWILANNLSGVGYSSGGDIVGGAGTAQQGVWKWIKLSAFDGGEPSINFTVTEGALTQTFEIGGREDGLSIDKIAFGPGGVQFTVNNLDLGQPGTPNTPPPSYPGGEIRNGLPLATGKAKFLGSVHSTLQLGTPGMGGFTNYFNQVTPENAGKWGSAEPQRDQMNWTQLDAAYDFAKSNGFPFKLHVLVWGGQQPGWIETLPPAEQLEEIEEWFTLLAARYPDLEYVEVVNEPIRQPPDIPGKGNYVGALGGAGATGWDWVLNAFRMARRIFPASTKLILNEYSITNETSVMLRYIEIVELLKAEGLIDIVGVQAHAFSTTVSAATTRANLDLLAATGVPITTSEFDIDGPTDQIQLDNYQRVFPIFWEHPAVIGITLWGYRPGLWRDAQGAALVRADGTEKPAMDWLVAYVTNNPPEILPGQLLALAPGTANGASVGAVAAMDLDDGTVFSSWQIAGGTSGALFSIALGTGELTVANSAGLNFTPGTVHEVAVKVSDGLTTSAPVVVRVVTASADGTPLVIQHPASQTILEAEPVTFTVEAVSTTGLSYQWRKDGVDIPGKTQASLTLAGTLPSDEGLYTVVVTNSQGSIVSNAAVLTVDEFTLPAVTQQPPNFSIAVDGSIVFSVAVTGNPPPALQWQRSTDGGANWSDLANGGVFSGATTSTLRVTKATVAMNGHRFRAVVTNSEGSTTSNAGTLNVAATTGPRMINLSALASAGAGDRTLVLGFFINGTGSKTVLIRGSGPTLAVDPFNRPGTVVDPKLRVFNSAQQVIAENDDWDPTLATSSSAVGAFPQVNGSMDAAMTLTLAPGLYTVHLVNDGPIAEGLIEVYDLSRDLGSRLTNLSCRFLMNPGQTLIVGTALIGGDVPVLARAVGPELGLPPYNIPGVLADPHMRLYNSASAEIGINDDWNVALQPYFMPAGAFGLTVGGKDAALRQVLTPGGYTVHATGQTGGGIAIVELYESPPPAP